MPIPPQSVQKTRARRVFGEFISDDENGSSSESIDSSLCYTETDSSTVSASLYTDKRTSSATVVKPMIPQTIDFLIRQSTEANALMTDKENVANQTQNAVTANTFAKETKPWKTTFTKPAGKNRRDLVKETQMKINNASKSVNESLTAARMARSISFEQRSRQISSIRNQWREEKAEASVYHEQSEKMRHDLLDFQRKLASSSTQARVKVDTDEKQKRLDAITHETEFKSMVFREHQQMLQEERDRKRRESIAARAKLRENHRQGLEILHVIRVGEDQAIYEERCEAFKASAEFKNASAQARRKSFQFRNGDARRIRELYNHLQREECQREAKNIQLKLDGARDVETYQKKLQEERRQSFASRNSDGKKQRDILKNLEEQELERDRASYELKWKAQMDADSYLRELESQRRESIAKRNVRAREQRELMERRSQEAAEKEQASIQLKLQGAQDADVYRRKIEEQHRIDLSSCNAYAKKVRNLQAEADSALQYAEHANYQLKWAAENDVIAYEEKMKKERRESLANRNKERMNHAKVMAELREIAHEKETESLMLKWAGENDAKVYLKKCEEEARRSLELRNAEARRHRVIEEQDRKLALDKAHEDEALKALGHLDMAKYKKKCSERDRNSLELRRKEANVQRLEEKKRHLEQADAKQKNRTLDDAARMDVVAYLKDCQGRRRMSLALRAKEKRHHRKWEISQAEQALSQRMQESRLRSQDRRAQEAALREERKRIALDAIRHAGCSFNVNGAAPLRVDY